MNSEQIRKFFADYQVVLKRVEQLEAAMRIKSDWDTWCAALRERAEFFRTEYARMNALMRSVMLEFAKEEPDLDDDAWKQLQISMMEFYCADTHDLALLMELAKILQKHYGHSNNLAAMTDVDLTLAYTNLEFSRILREPYGTRARDYYRKISVLSRNFGAIKEHSVHQAIVVAYANLVMSCCVLGTVTMQEAFDIWEEMKELQASDALAATRESEPDVGRLLDIFTERFRTDAYALAKSFDRTIEAHTRFVPPELMSRIEQITAEYYEKLDKPEESTADMFQIITSQCEFDCETGRRTADECWKEIHTFFRKTKPKVEQLGFELAVEPVTGEAVGDVAADVGVEEDRVADAVAVFAEAADGDVDVDARALVDDAERHRRRRTVFVADELLGIEVVDALVLGRLTAEGEALADVFEGGEDVLAQLAAEQRRLRRGIVFEFAGLRAELGDLALIDDDHALAVGNRDDGAVGDDVVRALRVAAAAGGPLLAADSHDAFRKRITIEILKPLIGHHAARGAQSCFDKSHLFTLLY